MLGDVKSGIVKVYFAQFERRYGFIQPDGGGPDIFFHRNSGSRIQEGFSGSLEFVVESHIDRDPRKGDRLVFLDCTGRRGPVAFEWNFEGEWDKAEALISARPWRECEMCRIIRHDQQTRKTFCIWEGYYPHLMELISRNDGTVLTVVDLAQWYSYTWCERRRVQGWDRLWNPRESLGKALDVSRMVQRLGGKFPPRICLEEIDLSACCA